MIYQRHLTKPHTLDEIGIHSFLHEPINQFASAYSLIERIMERDLFMGAEEAKEMGLVDEILVTRKKLPSEEAPPS